MVQLSPRLRTGAILASRSNVIGGGGGDVPDSSPSGQAMPLTAPTGWVPYYRQDFNEDCTRGNFLATYNVGSFDPVAAAAGRGLVNAYPTSYNDTSGRGIYDPAGLSCSGGVLFKHIWYDASISKMRVSAPVPKLSASGWGYVGSSRRSVRARCVAPLATIKTAWLDWPLSNHSTTLATAGIPDTTSTSGFRGGDGEIDFPEANIGSPISWFMHKQNAKSTDASKQTSGSSTVNFADGAWHTYTRTRIVGSYNTGSGTWVGQQLFFELDGVQVGATQIAAVPMTPMRWVLQTETILSTSTPIATDVDGQIEIDWILVDVPG